MRIFLLISFCLSFATTTLTAQVYFFGDDTESTRNLAVCEKPDGNILLLASEGLANFSLVEFSPDGDEVRRASVRGIRDNLSSFVIVNGTIHLIQYARSGGESGRFFHATIDNDLNLETQLVGLPNRLHINSDPIVNPSGSVAFLQTHESTNTEFADVVVYNLTTETFIRTPLAVGDQDINLGFFNDDKLYLSWNNRTNNSFDYFESDLSYVNFSQVLIGSVFPALPSGGSIFSNISLNSNYEPFLLNVPFTNNSSDTISFAFPGEADLSYVTNIDLVTRTVFGAIDVSPTSRQVNYVNNNSTDLNFGVAQQNEDFQFSSMDLLDTISIIDHAVRQLHFGANDDKRVLYTFHVDQSQLLFNPDDSQSEVIAPFGLSDIASESVEQLESLPGEKLLVVLEDELLIFEDDGYAELNSLKLKDEFSLISQKDFFLKGKAVEFSTGNYGVLVGDPNTDDLFFIEYDVANDVFSSQQIIIPILPGKFYRNAILGENGFLTLAYSDFNFDPSTGELPVIFEVYEYQQQEFTFTTSVETTLSGGSDEDFSSLDLIASLGEGGDLFTAVEYKAFIDGSSAFSVRQQLISRSGENGNIDNFSLFDFDLYTGSSTKIFLKRSTEGIVLAGECNFSGGNRYVSLVNLSYINSRIRLLDDIIINDASAPRFSQDSIFMISYTNGDRIIGLNYEGETSFGVYDINMPTSLANALCRRADDSWVYGGTIQTNFSTLTRRFDEVDAWLNDEQDYVNTQTSTGTEDISDSSIAVFPNPSKNVTTIDLPNSSSSQLIQFIATDGKVYNRTFVPIGQKSIQVELNSLPAGNYTILVDGDKSVRFTKI